MSKQIIGDRETIDFIDYGMKGLVAKIDTGAYYGTVHCKDIVIGGSKHAPILSFALLDEKHPQYSNHKIKIYNFRRIVIANSSGVGQHRYLVPMRVGFQGQEFETYFSLADRSKMVAPVLLGRYFLSGRFLVDVDKYNKEEL